MTRLIEKGTNIWFYEIEDCYGRTMCDFEIILGEDILKSDDEYDNYNGDLVVPVEKVEDAIYDYMSENYPEVHDYMYDIDGE